MKKRFRIHLILGDLPGVFVTNSAFGSCRPLLCLLLVVFTGSAAGLMERGNSLYEAGSYDSAVIIYKKAIGAGENPGLAWFNIGNAYFRQDNTPRAIIAYRSAISHAPEFFRGWLNLAVAYYTIDQQGECIATLHHALRLKPEDIQARLVMASAYRKTGELPKAVVYYEQIAEQNPQTGDAFIALAEIYRELEDHMTAMRWLKRYPPDGQNHVYVLQSLSEIAEMQGDLQQALYYAREAFAQERSKWLIYRIVSLTLEMGTDHVALQHALQGLEIFPEFGDLALLGGKIAFELEQYGQAEHLFSVAAAQGMAGGVIGLENIRAVLGDRGGKTEGRRIHAD